MGAARGPHPHTDVHTYPKVSTNQTIYDTFGKYGQRRSPGESHVYTPSMLFARSFTDAIHWHTSYDATLIVGYL